jgi:sulfate permease, SulP family
VTASLEIENAIRDAVDKGRQVYIVGIAGKVKERLEKLGILKIISPDHLFTNRTDALRQAVETTGSYGGDRVSNLDDESDMDWQSAVQVQ